jgi:hypothetical protein
MCKDFNDLDMAEFVPKFVAQVRQNRQLKDVATEYDCRGRKSVPVPIVQAGIATHCVHEVDVISSGARVKNDVITTNDWNAAEYLDYHWLYKNNFSYETLMEKTLIADAVCRRMDQTILDALGAAENVLCIREPAEDPLELFVEIKTMLDSQNLCLSQEDRCLIMPAAAWAEFSINDQMMSNNYIQEQICSTFDGKVGKLLGFKLIPMRNIDGGGLKYQITPDGTKKLWTCYATTKVSIGYAFGYGIARTADGTGGIFMLDKVPERCSALINAPFCDGAKVLIPNGIVEFTLETKNY